MHDMSDLARLPSYPSPTTLIARSGIQFLDFGFDPVRLKVREWGFHDAAAANVVDDLVLELRRAFGPGMVTSLGRIEGKPLGIVANNPTHLAGAIDSDGSDKAARFLQLCDAFDIPILFLCDTPGMMVGPEVEKTALVRHCSRLFVTGANLTVPFGTIVLRKA